MLHNLGEFDTIQKSMWEAYGEPSYEFSHSTRGSHNKRISEIRGAIGAMFGSEANNDTIHNAFEVVGQNWRDFSLEFVSVSADPTTDSKGADYDFHKNYANARKAFFSYGDEDSLRGLITFAMNRVSWSGQDSER